jgi:hypothetical protein
MSVGGSSSATSGTGAGGATATSGTGIVGSSSTGVGAGGNALGDTCDDDASCQVGLVCVKDTDNDPIFGGGPARGFCTAVCDTDADCPAPEGVCLKAGDGMPGRCSRACTLGPALVDLDDPLDTGKCLGREDVRCAQAKIGAACAPTCGSDAQCNGGRVCDPQRRVCVDVPHGGLPPGAACDQNNDECAGLCIGFKSGDTMCSSPCVLGGELLSTDDCGGPEEGLCVFRPAANGAGDYGFCTPSCSAHDECQGPAFWCFGLAGVSEVVQRGYCFGASPCPGGQPDCDAKGGWTCTDTAYGKFCLDPSYPFTPITP